MVCLIYCCLGGCILAILRLGWGHIEPRGCTVVLNLKQYIGQNMNAWGNSTTHCAVLVNTETCPLSILGGAHVVTF
jgi:hypothetical protein